MTPWTAPSGNSYRLCLLDTNALSEIVKHPTVEGRGFVSRHPPATHAPCFTFYNLIEIRRDDTVFSKFVEFFSAYPAFLLQVARDVVRFEDGDPTAGRPHPVILNAFSALGRDSSYDIRTWIEHAFSDPNIRDLEQGWRDHEAVTLNTWLQNKDTFTPKRAEANAADADKYVEEAMPAAVASFLPHWESQVFAGDLPEPQRYPMLRAMLYSQYYRVFDPTWKPRRQEVTDVQIAAYIPYVDTFVTERFQAEICRKLKRGKGEFRHLDVATISDLRASA